MIKLAGKLADGVILINNTVEYAREAAAAIRNAAMDAGRDPNGVQVTCRFSTCVSHDIALARRAAKISIANSGRQPFYSNLYRLSGFEREARLIMEAWRSGKAAEAANSVTDEMASRMTVYGTPEECRAKIEDYRRAGIGLPVLTPLPADGDAKKAAIDVMKAFQ
jgi:5,10-methylenetetrahydromethanopterin reductase